MTDYTQALAAAREAVQELDGFKHPELANAYIAHCVGTLRDLLAALDAAQPVAWRYRRAPKEDWQTPQDYRGCLVGDGDEWQPLHTAPPAQVAEGYVTLASAEALALEAMRVGNIAGHNRTVEGCWSEAVGFRFEEFMADEGEAILVPKAEK